LLAPLDDPITGAYLMLHGSCVAQDEDDPEGRVLAELRARLGPHRPIVASLDSHASLTPKMVDADDAFTAYRTCPHIDTRRGASRPAGSSPRRSRGTRGLCSASHRDR
jgi:microcystin degradation protein MlrC